MENWWNKRLIADRAKWLQEKRNMPPEKAREEATQHFSKSLKKDGNPDFPNFAGKDQINKKINRVLTTARKAKSEGNLGSLGDAYVPLPMDQKKEEKQQKKRADVKFPSDTVAEEDTKTPQDILNHPFQSKFEPEEMRQLALVAHNNMKPAMMEFIKSHAEILEKFCLIGTNTTIAMCRSVFGKNKKSVVFGTQCVSGPLGGDAELCAELTRGSIGGAIFFIDPLSAHPHQCDIDSFVRLCNVHNIIFSTNPTSAVGTMYLLRDALLKGNKKMITSFFETLESPAVPAYKASQRETLLSVTEQ